MSKKRKKPGSTRRVQINPWVLAQIVAQSQENPKPVRIAPEARRVVADCFPETKRSVALAALQRYRGPETSRVHRAVLALSGGKFARLEAMVHAANGDYRDVLYWAEYPQDSAAGTQKQKCAAARRMAARWRKMGLKVPFKTD